jgi:hypothetical protein
VLFLLVVAEARIILHVMSNRALVVSFFAFFLHIRGIKEEKKR